MNTPVNFEIHKLLIGKEIDLSVRRTIAEVVMWLYEKHGIWITVCIVEDSYFRYWVHNKNIELQDTKSNWLAPTEAYEAAIIYTLKNLI